MVDAPAALLTLLQHPPSHDEWHRLERLWCAREMWRAGDIVREMMLHGPVKRTSRDVLLMLDVMLGPGRKDSTKDDGEPDNHQRALVALAGRATLSYGTARHDFYLDGRPADWAMVARAANVVLRHLGFPIIAGPWEKVAT